MNKNEHKQYLSRAKTVLARLGKRNDKRRIEFEMRWARWIDKTDDSSYTTLTAALDRVAAYLDQNPGASALELSTNALWGGVDGFLQVNKE